MTNYDGRTGLRPPPVHPLSPSASAPPSPSASSLRLDTPPALPPRPSSRAPSPPTATGDEDAYLEEESQLEVPPDSPTSSKLEEGLSEEQLRELYDDEEIDRFLHLFSSVSCVIMNLCDTREFLADISRIGSTSARFELLSQ